MKKMLCVIAILGIFASLSGQEFQTKMSGNINDKSIFQQKVINSNKWVDAVCAPYGYVIVNKDHILTINEPYELDSIYVMTKGTLIVNAKLSLLVPVITKGNGKVVDPNGLIQLPLTTIVLDNTTTNLFNAYCTNGILKINASTYGDLQIVSYWGTLAFASEIQGESNYEFTPNLHNGIYVARFTTGNLVLTKKFVYNK